jgi:hypothetical protein
MKHFMTFAEYLHLRERPGNDLEHDPIAERSIMAGIFKAVNPARPVSPTNSRLLAAPFKKKLKSQVIGR